MRPAFDLSLYLVTDPILCGPRGVREVVRQAIAGGATLIQLRDPHAETGALVEEARALRALIQRSRAELAAGARANGGPARPPVQFIVNDRVDVALAAGADGVHLGQSDMSPTDARALLGPDKLIGLSVSSPEELTGSDLRAVDYLGVGSIYATSTKPDAGAPIGPAGLAAIEALTHLPIVAIGGIHAGNASAAIEAGAQGVAVVSAICAAADPRTAARELRELIDLTTRKLREH